jgi:chemotaxis protein histidine kinase CheA
VSSEFSGRGIGMGAARAACQKRGGTMLIHSDGGGGTRIEFRFPRSQMADEPEARLVA